jgi:CRP/FNR family transcriptional regulator
VRQPKPDCNLCKVRCLGPLASLSPQLLDEFNQCKTSRSYQPGQIIFYEDNQPYGIYCVSSGTVKLTRYTGDGKSYISRLAKAGDLLGYRAFLTHEPYSATAEVVEEAMLCFITREVFSEAMRKAPALTLELMSRLGTDLRAAEDRARDLAYKSVPERLAELLLRLKESFGQPQADGSVLLGVQLSREELASMLGTTVETTVRTLTHFRQKKLIVSDKKKILIQDVKKLAEYIPGV